ncbi:UNVERIFIED_CONTAM: hypothetical protein Sradi_3873900 [Sesamum radiatum]|uniref:Uncharacterized protein n=1 Tax=Sesamum radiatum TaxID=300843 RepID=A0AAW2Q2F9_SESRA
MGSIRRTAWSWDFLLFATPINDRVGGAGSATIFEAVAKTGEENLSALWRERGEFSGDARRQENERGREIVNDG